MILKNLKKNYQMKNKLKYCPKKKRFKLWEK